MMSPSWELLCEMNFNLRVFTQRGEGENSSLLYLIWKVREKIILHHYRGKSQIQLAFHFHFTKQTYLIFIQDVVTAVFKLGSLTIKLTRYCEAKLEL